uniref:Myeloid-associated differentiation marker-like protein n=1 Tax=Callorhinchus milii TaxID=7868 RepID=K4FY54_CALMI|nr:myeloid-associated differentiation marker-like protein [Callorhinchus milii]
MPGISLDLQSMTTPVGIVRFLEIFLSCTAFSLIANVQEYKGAYGGWCMFTWCFSFALTILIVILELTEVHRRIPISWADFTTSFAMMATLMNLTSFIIYPSIFLVSENPSNKDHKLAATAMACLCFVAYAAEVSLTRARQEELSGFLTTVPGLLKVLEAFVACIIFVSIEGTYSNMAGRQWCMAVYCVCFIIALLIIIGTIAKLISRLPFPFERFLTAYNILAVLMYLTAAIMWPIFYFRDNTSRPPKCPKGHCEWDNMLIATVLTFVNLAVYIVDLFYSARLVFVTVAS